MKLDFWTSNAALLAALIIGMILGHLAAMGDIALQPPCGTVAALAAALIAYAALSAIRARHASRLMSHNPSAAQKKEPATVERPSAPSRLDPPSEPHPSTTSVDAVALLSQQCDLSAREREILALLAQGLTASDVQDQLVISMNTVKTHMRHIYAKLEVHSSAELHEKLAAAQRDRGRG